MPDDALDTVRLQDCVERWQRGERAAADELLLAVSARMEQLARRMLRGFPNVHTWADTADVLQGSLLRLLTTLRNLCPESVKQFIGLAALHIRRELLDLARRFQGRNQREVVEIAGTSESWASLAQAADPSSDAVEELELWSRFHEKVEQLPPQEREVVGLLFYHGWAQAQAAELLQVDVRTIRNRWQSACRKLHDLLEGQLPPL
jgi:RNA polymerase sigma-70 factor (ECF subfamily)